MNPPETIYQEQLSILQSRLNALLLSSRRLGWLRVFVFAITGVLSYFIFTNFGLPGFVVVVAGLALLLWLVSLDTDTRRSIAETKALININLEELSGLEDKFQFRYDGAELEPPNHNYAHDLDIFGNASVFQWLNRASSEQGRQKLANGLCHPASIETIEERQRAVEELCPMLEWRQQWQAFSSMHPVTAKMEKKTREWIAQDKAPFQASFWRLITIAYSTITISTIILAIGGLISGAVFSSLYLLYFFFAFFLSRNTIRPYLLLSGIVEQFQTLGKLVDHFESVSWKSSLLSGEASRLSAFGKAGNQIRKLKAILDRFDLRVSVLGIAFLNPFLLWDVQQMIALNIWRRTNGRGVFDWFQMIAEVEVLVSLATLRFNKPHWCIPEIAGHYCTLHGVEIGHPLIPQSKRIDNDFRLEGTGKVTLITGSNMAGKSTFLRTVGVNLVLAQLGAVVSASQFHFAPVKIMSSMRIADNLADNTSTFYAELKKLENIIRAVNAGEEVLVLLDEILRGTNSLDRHKGSAAVIRQLIHRGSAALIASHDLDLALIKNEFPDSFENFHFDVAVSGEELYFDYLLKPGVCTSLNASILMKKIGLEVS